LPRGGGRGDGEAVGQLAVRADCAADAEQDAATGDVAGEGLDAGHRVAKAGDDVAGASAVLATVGDRLFSNAGVPLNRNSAGHQWRQVRKAAGLDRYTLHDLTAVC
jgi:hypothetical protein